MRKKKYEKLLRRLCFAAACCLMLVGAAAPVTAFAAEDPADPGGSVTLIKAGAYRFNDVLVGQLPSSNPEFLDNPADVYFDFTVEYMSSVVDCIGFYLDPCDGNVTRMDYYLSESISSVHGIDNATVYVNGVWNSQVFGESVQTITIPTDQDVSVEFAEWFRTNTVPVSPSSNVLEGEWTLRPYMTIPSRSFEFEANFTVTGFGSVDGVHYDFVGQCDSIYVLIDDGYDLAVSVNVVSSVPNFENYGESYPFFMHVYKEFTNGEISFSVFVEPVTIDFGDGVVVDDPYIYEWFTSNAKPVGAPVDLEDIVTDSIRAPLSWVGSFLNALISGPLAPVFSVFAIAIAISLIFVVIVLIKRFVWGV